MSQLYRPLMIDYMGVCYFEFLYLSFYDESKHRINFSSTIQLTTFIESKKFYEKDAWLSGSTSFKFKFALVINHKNFYINFRYSLIKFIWQNSLSSTTLSHLVTLINSCYNRLQSRMERIVTNAFMGSLVSRYGAFYNSTDGRTNHSSYAHVWK